MWLPPIPQADGGVVARPARPGWRVRRSGAAWRPPGFPGLAVRRVRQWAARTACAQAGRSVSLPAPIVVRRKVIGERGGDLDEAAPRSRRHLTGSVDNAAGPQMPVERHLDHHLTL